MQRSLEEGEELDMTGITLTGYRYETNKDTERKTMVVFYEIDGREKSAPLKKLAAAIEATLPEIEKPPGYSTRGHNGQEQPVMES
jgi:hypothetical protein